MMSGMTRRTLWMIRAGALALFLPIATVGLLAQQAADIEEPGRQEIEPVSEDELDGFAVALYEVQVLQAELEEQVDTTLGESELGEQRFHEINELAQNPPASGELPGVSDGELVAYQETLRVLVETHNEVQERMVDVVLDQDLEVDRFNEIIIALRTDEELLGRLRPRMEELTQRRQEEEG